MAAYMIVYLTETDPVRMNQYREALMPLFAKHGVKAAAADTPTVLEGDWPWQRAFILQWPSRAIAEEFWHSPEYTAVKALRAGAAEVQVVVLDAIPAVPGA